ncbi:MAG TPA: histidine kinase [Flavobacteriaceae bacterium]|jgi:signal-transduction protein with cAMP-binding, CBS, and nucleotidyltransferase domain|nr:histidine kinase [Flavobacteriaceae bacterium]HBS12089.1 histidine kinase [Flavobacteriaceae bacterium]
MNKKRSYQSAKEVMTKKVVLIDGMATAKEAVELMRKENVESLIIKKRYAEDAFGIVNVHDFIKGVILQDKTSEEVNIFEIMTKPVIGIPANMDAKYVASFLTKVNIELAPVEENGEFIGMVSLADLILENLSF